MNNNNIIYVLYHICLYVGGGETEADSVGEAFDGN